MMAAAAVSIEHRTSFLSVRSNITIACLKLLRKLLLLLWLPYERRDEAIGQIQFADMNLQFYSLDHHDDCAELIGVIFMGPFNSAHPAGQTIFLVQ